MIVPDANVLVYAFLERPPLTAAARRFVETAPSFIAPTLCLTEVAATVTKYVRLGEMPAQQGRDIIAAIGQALPELVPDPVLLAEAVGLSLELHASLYDCLYLALARQRALRFVTADAAFTRRVTASPHVAQIVYLPDWTPDRDSP